MPKKRKLAGIAKRIVKDNDLMEQGLIESEKKQEETVEGSPTSSKPSSPYLSSSSSSTVSDEADDVSALDSSTDVFNLAGSDEVSSSQPTSTVKRYRADVKYTHVVADLEKIQFEKDTDTSLKQQLIDRETTQDIEVLKEADDESCVGSPPVNSSLSTSVASSSDYVRVSQRLRGVSISPQAFELIKSTVFFDDRQAQERENVGSAWGRFESAKGRKHCVVGLDQLPLPSQENIRSALEQRPNVVPTFLPGTPSPKKSTPPNYIWTPSRTTRLEESSTFTIGDIKLSIFIEKSNMKRRTGFVATRNLTAALDKEAGLTDQKLLMSASVSAENEAKQENKDGNVVLSEGSAIFNAEKYNKSYRYHLEKHSRSQVSIKKVTAGEFFESKGYENVLGSDGKHEAEWLDGLSRDLLRRASTSIVVNNVPCKVVPKNLNLVALEDGKTVCTNLNLFAGTRGSNTHMMIAEGVVRMLLRKGIDVTVRYKYIDDREMDYFIETKETQTIRFKFDTKKYDSPTSLEPKLVNTVIEEIVEAAQQKLSSAPSTPFH